MLDPKRQVEILQRWNHSVQRRTGYGKKTVNCWPTCLEWQFVKLASPSIQKTTEATAAPINWKLISTLGSRTKSLSCPSGVNFPLCSKIYQPLVEEAWSQQPSLQSWDGSHKGHGSSSLYPSPLHTKGMDPIPKAEQFVLIITTFR